MSEEERFQIKKDRIRKCLVKYTRKAFRMLPELNRPRILDIGCGRGAPTIELAKLSQGEIIGIDIDQVALNRLDEKIEKAALSARVKTMRCSMSGMDFPDESFDVIWSEGSIYVVGFKRGLQEWKRFLKQNGFMVVHDEKGDVTTKLEQIFSCGYELLSYFILNEDTWRAEYFTPLEELIGETRRKYSDDQKVLEALHDAQLEIDMFKKNPESNSSAYFVMKKD